MWLIILLLLSILFIIFTTTVLNWHPFLSLILASFGFGIFSGSLSLTEVVEAVNSGFGKTIGYIGIVILAGSVIGKFLEKSGGAFQLANGALKLTGNKNVPLAMSIVGYVVSICVFCDSAFIVLSPLAKALTRKVKVTLATLVIALSLGLYITHSLIPPTPGPVAAAGILGADVGMVILLGIPASIIALVATWLFAVKVASKYDISEQPLSDTGALDKTTEKAPSLSKSLLPILIPILLIVLRSIIVLPSNPLGTGKFQLMMEFLGQPSVALLIGVGLSFLLPAKLNKEMFSTSGWFGQGVISAAGIIIITGSGGAFGTVLQESGIGEIIGKNLKGAQSLGIWLPIIIAAALKIAQGSSTVAIITSASLMVPLVTPLGLDSSTARALLVVAIGSGSMIASHANDSYFWVVSQFSGMTVSQGYRLQTAGTLITGICASITIWIISLLIL